VHHLENDFGSPWSWMASMVFRHAFDVLGSVKAILGTAGLARWEEEIRTGNNEAAFAPCKCDVMRAIGLGGRAIGRRGGKLAW
jgi:hypothetical protein